MKRLLLVTSIILSFVGYGQNWDVFNKNYRYNYKYNYSQLISNVLFVKTTSVVATDTVYQMNNIGVVNGNTVTPDQPQFLQKTIVKQSNGDVKFLNTGSITIIPTCTINQSWLFDANQNYSATCISMNTVNIFSVIDSVKFIIVNYTDSVLLSKQFGVIQYPFPYAQNKYYRLVGIENANSYDSIPLFGSKVPNAWDIYRFDAGDKMCLDAYFGYTSNPPVFNANCQYVTRMFNSRTIQSNSYSYGVLEIGRSKYWPNQPFNGYAQWNEWQACSSGWGWPTTYPPLTSLNTTLTFSNLNSASLYENKMYPGMQDAAQAYDGVAQFGLDNNGTFYKYFGGFCQNGGITTMPTNTPSLINSVGYGVGLGRISDYPYLFEGVSKYCVTSFVKGSTVYFNPFYTVDVPQQNRVEQLSFFPNPANSQLMLPVKQGNLKVYDVSGKLMKEEIFQTGFTNIANLPNGLYFIEIQSDSFKSTQKLIIRH